MRKSYVEDPETGGWIEREAFFAKYGAPEKSGMIMPDIPDFISPVDGKVVGGRRALREHNKRHNVTNTADFTNVWKKQSEERAKAYVGGQGYDSARRIEHLKRAYEKLRSGR